MKKNLEGKLFSKKRAEELYLYALSRGDKVRAEKLKEFYDLDCNFEKSVNKVYKAHLALGEYEKANRISLEYNLNRNLIEDKKSLEIQVITNNIYNRFLDKQYLANIQMQQQNENMQIISLISLNEKLEAHKSAKELVAKTKISRKPDADYVYITTNPPFREYELMKEVYTKKALEQNFPNQNNIVFLTPYRRNKLLQTA